MQHILITGAAIAALAARQGHQVIAADLNAEALATRWGGKRNVRCETLDVTKAKAWAALVTKLEKEGIALDVLINVAGVLRSGQTGELTPRDIDLTFDVNVKGVIYGANAATACYGCHTAQKDRDYVFSSLRD